MAVRQDIIEQVNRYRGYIGWEAFTDGQGNYHPAVDIQLFIKSHPLPQRKPKVSEINTISNLTQNGYESGTAAIFFGGSDLLQIAIEGWIITPLQKSGAGFIFNPVDRSGTALNWGSITYSEVVSAYLVGKVNLNSVGAYQRRDPDYYESPYGHRYTQPIISAWSSNYSPIQKKQPFSMTLLLEK